MSIGESGGRKEEREDEEEGNDRQGDKERVRDGEKGD